MSDYPLNDASVNDDANLDDTTELNDDAPSTGETLGGTRPDPTNAASKDPEEWVTGDEPITAAQKSYLDTLARQAGEERSADMTKAEASEQIDRLQKKTGRGA
jgi:hypothetical protein